MRFERDLLRERQRNREVLERLQVSMNLSTAANETLRQQMEEIEQVADDPQQKEYDKDKSNISQHIIQTSSANPSPSVSGQIKNNHAKNKLALRAGIDMGERSQIENYVHEI